MGVNHCANRPIYVKIYVKRCSDVMPFSVLNQPLFIESTSSNPSPSDENYRQNVEGCRYLNISVVVPLRMFEGRWVKGLSSHWPLLEVYILQSILKLLTMLDRLKRSSRSHSWVLIAHWKGKSTIRHPRQEADERDLPVCEAFGWRMFLPTLAMLFYSTLYYLHARPNRSLQ